MFHYTPMIYKPKTNKVKANLNKRLTMLPNSHIQTRDELFLLVVMMMMMIMPWW